eukprot:5624712-Pyramimonas_sp.AAC.1
MGKKRQASIRLHTLSTDELRALVKRRETRQALRQRPRGATATRSLRRRPQAEPLQARSGSSGGVANSISAHEFGRDNLAARRAFCTANFHCNSWFSDACDDAFKGAPCVDIFVCGSLCQPRSQDGHGRG